MGKSLKKRLWAEEQERKDRSERASQYIKSADVKWKKKRQSRTKNVSGSDVLMRIPHLDLLRDFWIRNLDDWKCKSYNPDRQEKDLIKFLLCRYPVPSFLFNVLYKKNLNGLDNDMLLLLSDMGHGNSPRDILKKQLSKKEMPYFYNGPYEDYISNLWYARCKSQGLNDKFITIFLNKNIHSLREISARIDSLYKEEYNFWKSVITFFVRYQNEIVPADIIDISDFFGHVQNDKYFSLKGRTLNSIIKLSNEWHDELNKVKNRPKEIISWKGMNIPDWNREVKYKDNKGNVLLHWNIKQITNNIELHREGNQQNHCVYSYVSRCQHGSSAIFTMYESLNTKNKITIEVNPSTRTIVQKKGKRNRQPNAEEESIISKWASENNLKIDKRTWRW